MFSFILIAISLVSLSFAPILVKWSQTPAEVIGFWRLLIAFLIVRILGQFTESKGPAPNRLKANWILPCISGFFFFSHLWTYFLAVQHTRVANCTILYSLNPLFTAIISVVFFKERFQRHWWLSILLAFSAIYLLFADNSLFLSTMTKESVLPDSLTSPVFHSWSDDLTGNVLALVSALFFSGYLITGNLSRKKLNNLQFTTIAYCTTAICFLIAAFSRGTLVASYPARTWIGIGLLIVFPTLLGHAIFTHLLSKFNVNFLSCLKLSEPIMTSLWAILIFDETVSRHLALSLGLCVASLFILVIPTNKLLKKT